jgi:glutaminase/asparaginase family protein
MVVRGYCSGPRILRRPTIHDFLPTARLEIRVSLLVIALGVDGGVVDAAVTSGCRGIVIAGMGTGDVPEGMGEALVRGVDAGVGVVLARKGFMGRVEPLMLRSVRTVARRSRRPLCRGTQRCKGENKVDGCAWFRGLKRSPVLFRSVRPSKRMRYGTHPSLFHRLRFCAEV